MNAPGGKEFLAGVIEGFYGKPWSRAERLELFGWMADWGLNTYLYAPKDDLKHRAIWREPYSQPEAAHLREMARACEERRLHFVYALSPGLDIHYRETADLEHLHRRFEQMLEIGVRHFALLFDDIPDRLDPADIARWGSLPSAQCQVVNILFRWTRERSPEARFFFCPTPYCGRMAGRKLGGEGYLATVGRELLPDIDIFWTGPEIISREITAAHVDECARLLRRKPLIWDNLHANDYDGRRFYCGPYAGRPPELRQAVSGLLSNPNNEFPLNYVPLRTLAAYVQAGDSWDARRAYLAAMREWWPSFGTVDKSISFEDLVLLGDCYYLPHEDGPEAGILYDRARAVLAADPADSPAAVAAFHEHSTRLRDTCARLAGLRDRPLFHALSRRVWELREELDLLDRYVGFKSDPDHARLPCESDFHLPLTYRGGIVPRLQRLLLQHPDGTFIAAREPQPPPPNPALP